MATFEVHDRFTPKLRGPCVSYLRSSDRTHSRLSVVAQEAAIDDLLEKYPARSVKVFTEHEPLISGKRPALVEAAAFCRNQKATLVFGRLKHMRAGVFWMKYLKVRGVKFLGADAPYINQMNFYDIEMQDTNWRNAMGEKVAKALATAKTHGASFGGKRGNSNGLRRGPAVSATARANAAKSNYLSTIGEIRRLRHRGISSLTGIAIRLNQMGHPAPRGGEWSPTQVRRVIMKFED